MRVGPHGQTNAILSAGGSVWITAYDVGRHQRDLLRRIIPESMSIERSIRIAGTPGWEVGGGGMAFGDGSLWVVGSRARQIHGVTAGPALHRIDPRGVVAASIPLRGFAGADVAVTRSGVWVATMQGDRERHGWLALVDPRTNSIRRMIRLHNSYVRRVVAVGGMIVVQEYASNGSGPEPFLEAVDPAAGRVVASSKDPRLAYEITQVVRWRDQLWATTADGAVRLDPRTLRPLGRPVRSACCFLASSHEGIWLEVEPRHTLALFDPSTRAVRAYPGIDAAAIAAAAGRRALWLLRFDGRLTRIAFHGRREH